MKDEIFKKKSAVPFDCFVPALHALHVLTLMRPQSGVHALPLTLYKPTRRTPQHDLRADPEVHPPIHGSALSSLRIRVLLHHLLLSVENTRRRRCGGGGGGGCFWMHYRRRRHVVCRGSPHRFFVFRRLAWDHISVLLLLLLLVSQVLRRIADDPLERRQSFARRVLWL